MQQLPHMLTITNALTLFGVGCPEGGKIDS